MRKDFSSARTPGVIELRDNSIRDSVYQKSFSELIKQATLDESLKLIRKKLEERDEYCHRVEDKYNDGLMRQFVGLGPSEESKKEVDILDKLKTICIKCGADIIDFDDKICKCGGTSRCSYIPNPMFDENPIFNKNPLYKIVKLGEETNKLHEDVCKKLWADEKMGNIPKVNNRWSPLSIHAVVREMRKQQQYDEIVFGDVQSNYVSFTKVNEIIHLKVSKGLRMYPIDKDEAHKIIEFLKTHYGE